MAVSCPLATLDIQSILFQIFAAHVRDVKAAVKERIWDGLGGVREAGERAAGALVRRG